MACLGNQYLLAVHSDHNLVDLQVAFQGTASAVRLVEAYVGDQASIGIAEERQAATVDPVAAANQAG